MTCVGKWHLVLQMLQLICIWQSVEGEINIHIILVPNLSL